MTTLHERPVQERLRNQSLDFYANYIPTTTETRHPYYHQKHLRFEPGHPMHRNGYVHVDEVFRIKSCDVERYWGDSEEQSSLWQLTPQSLRWVKREVRFRTRSRYSPPREQYRPVNPPAPPVAPPHQAPAPPPTAAQPEAADGDQEHADQGYGSAES